MQRMLFSRCLTAALVLQSGGAAWAGPSAEQALALKPIHAAEVEFDQPSADEVADCKIAAEKIGGSTGWVVRSGQGVVLRRFLDSSGDGHVNQWCYFKDGVEVYRDMDSDGDKKVDQSRWLNQAGSRWGLDRDQDGEIDAWKQISAEEVSAEIVAALRERDADRFARVVLSDEEIDALLVGEEMAEELKEKAKSARADFVSLARKQSIVTGESRWTHFGGVRPGVVPADSLGGRNDLTVYENVLAMIEGGEGQNHVQIGALVQTGAGWRAIGLPMGLADDVAHAEQSGFFFAIAGAEQTLRAASNATATAPDEATAKLLAELEKIDDASSKLTATQRHARRADVLERLIASAETADDRSAWVRQFADIVGAAVQSGEFKDGLARLSAMEKQVAKQPGGESLVPYVRYRRLMSDYISKQMAEGADYEKIQKAWIKQLRDFVEEFPSDAQSAEAMLEVATTYELAGQNKDAVRWYEEVVKRFDSTSAGRKAAGAVRRLDGVGKPLAFTGKTADGQDFDLSRQNGRIVVLHYWASWSDLCARELAGLKRTARQYAGKNILFVGVNLDHNKSDFQAFVKKSGVNWPQLHDPAGFDGSLAEHLGVRTVPAMVVVDAKGRLAAGNIRVAELGDELDKLLK